MLAIGTKVYSDYGIAWDETYSRKTGLISYNYVFHNDNSLKTFKDKDYGVAFELPLIVAEKLLALDDSRDIFLMRHLFTHLFYLVGTVGLYILLYILFESPFLALTGTIMLLCNPLIYSHSFFNSKDIPLMSLFIICALSFVIAIKKQRVVYFILFGFLCGLLTNLRVIGILFFGLTTVIAAIDFLINKQKTKILLCYVGFALAFTITLISSWPYLWDAPIQNLMTVIKNMSKFRWDRDVLFLGTFYKSNNLPWTYIPTWIGITTPLPYLFLFFSGMFFLILRIIRHPELLFSNNVDRFLIVFFLIIIFPFIAIILLHSIVYDGWRHLYFIYPFIILVAVYGLNAYCKLINHSNKIFIYCVTYGFLSIGVIKTVIFMIENHPYQNVYFNEIVSKKEQAIRNNFEMDYWGTSYKQALEYVVSNDESSVINIMVANDPGRYNALILNSHERSKINFVDWAPGNLNLTDYVISNYRWHPKDYEFLPEKKYFNVKVLNSDIISVWKICKRD